MNSTTRRHLIATVLLVISCWVAAPVAAAVQQPPSSAAQEGFVPIDQLQPKEQLPAAPLVMAAYSVAWLVIFGYVWSIWRRLSQVEQEIRERQPADRGRRPPVIGNMTSAHFIFIPAVLLVGIIIGWVLGSRAAADAYAVELKRREERAKKVLPPTS